MSGTPAAIPATTLVPGRAAAPPFLLSEPLSFWGGFDARSGTIVDRWHPQAGQRLADRILLMTAGRGSSSGSSVLAEAIRLGTGPGGLVLLTRDAIVTVGAMIANELYGTACPVVVVEAVDWPRLAAAAALSIIADGERGHIICEPRPA